MILEDGILYICRLVNTAEPGRKPVPQLQKIDRCWFQERTIGLNREYLAKGVNERVDLYVYIHKNDKVRIGMYAMLGNGEQFRINSVHRVIEENTNLLYTTMEMQRLDTNYDVIAV